MDTPSEGDAAPVTPTGVCIANLNPGTIRHEYLLSLLSIIEHDRTHSQHIKFVAPRIAGPLLGIYRNMAVEHFLTQTTAEWLWFQDSDMIIPPDALDRLLESADPVTAPVVSALYFMSLDEGIRPSIFHRIPDADDDEKIQMTPDEDWPVDELVSADGVGAGCLLIHRSLLQAMYEVYGAPRPWFGEDIFDKVVYGEDFFFCMRVKQMGFDLFVNTGVECGHVKHFILTADNVREAKQLATAKAKDLLDPRATDIEDLLT